MKNLRMLLVIAILRRLARWIAPEGRERELLWQAIYLYIDACLNERDMLSPALFQQLQTQDAEDVAAGVFGQKPTA